jgi:short-subunit dehydrogenase
MEQFSATPLALVTGASSGIGLELARQFAEHGFDLVIVAENDAIRSAASELEAYGQSVVPLQIDLASDTGVDELYTRLEALDRQVDAVAINAGVGVGGAFVDNDLAAEINLINLNVTSVVRLAKRTLQDMVARNAGRVLFTASIAAEAPGPFHAVYAASKAFVLSFAEAVRNELKDTNITITALQPGATDTNFFARAGMEDTKVAVGPKSDPRDVAKEGFDALMKGKDHVVSAMMKEKVKVAAGHVLPETFKAEQNRKETEPGSANQ